MGRAIADYQTLENKGVTGLFFADFIIFFVVASLSTHLVFIIDNQCFSLKKVGNSKYAFYTLSKSPLLTYLTFFYGCSGFYRGFIGAKVQIIAHHSHNYPKKFGSLEKCAYFCSCKHTILIFYTLI